jgi:cytoskeletal protein RodZ
MSSVGRQLRKAREEKELSLEQVQKATRIKRVYLEAIEADRLDDLPGPVQARGFVRSYASHVGLDPDALLGRLDGVSSQTVVAPLPSPPATGKPLAGSTRPVAAPRPSPAPRISTESSFPLPLPILIAGAIVLFVIGGLLLIQALRAEAPPPTPTLPASVPLSVSQTVAATPTAPPIARVSVTLTPSEHVWVRVTHDGLTAFEGFMEPGQSQTWEAGQQVIVETGNGAALSARVNGEDVGVLGPRNRVVVRAWGVEGEVTPAPTATPVPPPTAESTATPAP